MIVKFIKGMSPYQAGEIAGFPEAEAQRLIKAEIAIPVKKNLDKPPVNKMVEVAPIKKTKKK